MECQERQRNVRKVGIVRVEEDCERRGCLLRGVGKRPFEHAHKRACGVSETGASVTGSVVETKRGPVGLLDTEAFLSPVSCRQDSSRHDLP